MAKNGNGNGKTSDASLMRGIRRIQGTAAPETDQGKRVPDSGNGGTANIGGRGTMEKK